MDLKLLPMLACPLCKGPLVYEKDELLCQTDKLAYPIQNDIPVLLASAARSLEPLRVLFVCSGNVCRSPTAEGIFMDRVKKENIASQFFIDSAGTHAQVGSAPAWGACRAAQQKGINIDNLVARQFCMADCENFDYIIAMDHDNLAIIRQLCPTDSKAKNMLLLDNLEDIDSDLDALDVPNPYQMGENGFEVVFDLIDRALDAFLKKIRS